MVSWIISRLVVLIFGTLYPAYYSYKAVKSKDIKEYVKWMMYWIIFALFTTAETFTDIFLCWFPFYYELKIAFVAWLLSPYTKGSSLLYRKFVHPTLSSKEKEIDDCLVQAKDRSYDALVHFGKRGLNVAATAAVMAASKGQGALSERLRSFSMQDLSTIRGDGAPAPSGPPPPGPGRASGKHGQPKMSRSASESASSSGMPLWTQPGGVLRTGPGANVQRPPLPMMCAPAAPPAGPGKTVHAHSVVEGDVDEGGVKAWEPLQAHNPLAFSDDEEEDLLDFMYKYKAPKRMDPPLEAPPRLLRSRFRKKSTSSSATETT
ncbi:receptor expression-enhancing protein 1 isoform X2 [Urocitellus parryii]|uniref:receptor expression-enhancing protein 1 isoform X2 n=1 Tax=Urocitellus parryii TaxID=9999 RepID=UPI000E55D5C3|nr:receptor expression-enhancing protein 1 isoform X2 [Urocitellus parryii]